MTMHLHVLPTCSQAIPVIGILHVHQNLLIWLHDTATKIVTQASDMSRLHSLANLGLNGA